MAYYSALMLAAALFTLVVLWSVIEILLQNNKEKELN